MDSGGGGGGGGAGVKINCPGQLIPPLQLSIRNYGTKKTAAFDLNYVGN